MGLFMQTSQATLDGATAIRENFTALTDQIRSAPGLDADATNCLLARAYLKAKADMDKLSGSNAAAAEARGRVLTGQVWGVDDYSAADKVSASISYRDAQDRAAALDGPHDALQLMGVAERSGDELLARAVASHAEVMGWTTVSDQYFATRPAKAQMNAELQQLTPSLKNLSTADVFMYVLPHPGGLEGVADYRLQAMASDPRFASLR